MKNNINAKELKDTVSLKDLLSGLGFEPVRRVGKEYRYFSMLRDSDTDPSFYVNDKKGTWYDHGLAKGGNVIDFGLEFWKGVSFQEVLEKIVHMDGTGHHYQRQTKLTNEPNYFIREIKDLGSSALLVNYTESRGVGRAAEGRLKEVYYDVELDNKIIKHFSAIGWQNESGTWEIRTPNFQGSLGPKAISYIPNTEKRLSVFEGYFDYLSWLTDNPFATDSALVLNSVSLLQAGIAKAKPFNDIFLFFDHDQAGLQATIDFTTAIPNAIDCSGIYKGYNDYNEKIEAEWNSYHLSNGY